MVVQNDKAIKMLHEQFHKEPDTDKHD